MKSSLDVLSALYQLLNVSAVTNEISGKVYIGDPDSKSQLEDVTVNSLANRVEYLQQGILNLNIYAYQLKSGRANLARFQELVGLISPMVDDVAIGDYHFQINDDKGIFKDIDKDGMFFYNIRLDFQILKNI